MNAPGPIVPRRNGLLALLSSMAFIFGLGACDHSPSADAVSAPGSASSGPPGSKIQAPAPMSSTVSAKPPKKERADRTHSALRCGECHEKMYDEWSTAAHAKANASALYRVLRKHSPDATCDNCHAPLSLLKEPAPFAEAEGVSCEVCHRIEEVRVSEPAPALVLLQAHEVKYGPRCDPTEPYFHRARCLPLFQKAELCAGCHLYYRSPAAGRPLIPVHTEYADFLKSRFAARGKSCQSCHMPGIRAELATGERERDGVPDHSFLGHRGQLRGTALSAKAVASWKPRRAQLIISLRNVRAGHAIPAGSPGRQLVLSVSARDAAGTELARAERLYQRRLVDEAGRVAPFYAAVRSEADTRIGPGEARREVLTFENEGIKTLHVLLAFRALDSDLAERLALPTPAPEVIGEASLELGPKKRGKRSIVLRR